MSERIDETTPGGYYIGTDGVPHDAHGRPIEVAEPEPVKTDGEAEKPPEASAPSEPEPVKTKKAKGK